MPTSVTVSSNTKSGTKTITLSKFASAADKAYLKKISGKSGKSNTYTDPPPILDNNPALVSGSIGAIEVGGKLLSFVFADNYSLTIPKTGTVVLGTGSAGYIPQFSDANTLAASNLKMQGSNVLTLEASGASTVTVPWTGVAYVGKIITLTPGAAISWDCSLGNIATLVPDQACTITPSNLVAGIDYTLIVTTSGSSSYVVTMASPFKVTGTLTTGVTTAKVFVLTFISNGTTLYEQGRTTAM